MVSRLQSPKTDYGYQTSELSHTYEYMMPQLLSLLPQPENEEGKEPFKILDLGCGNGSLCHFLQKKGYDMTGIDPSKSGISLAKEQFPICKFINAGVYDLPKSLEGTFDIVISADVIEHLYAPKELAKVAKSCLKPDGMLIVTTPYHGYLKNLTMALFGKLDQHFSPLWDGGHIKFFSVSSLNKLIDLLHNYFCGMLTDLKKGIFSLRLDILGKSVDIG